MAEDEYNKKLESLQQYIPFLNNMIVQLRDPRKKNREQQLTKMVSLHSMITDKKKKLKLETLIKCEDVILKLYDKVKSGSHSQGPPQRSTPMSASTPFSPITPSSPSPPRDIPKTKPVMIPTEKIVDCDSKLVQPSSNYKAKIDVYSSAADSLKIPPLRPSPFSSKGSVFERLGKKTPDMSKPPISFKDLEALQEDNGVDTEKMSLNELTNLREQLQKQLKSSDDPDTSAINTTVRNTTILTKKAVEKTMVALEGCKIKSPEAKSPAKGSPVAKPVKVIKEAASIFGSTLSSIDNQILGGVGGKQKEKERRNSTGVKKDTPENKDKEKKSSTVVKKDTTETGKERRNSKDDKKPESSHKSTKDKTERKSSEHGHKGKDKKEEGEKKSSGEKSKDKKVKDDAKKHDKTKKECKEEKEKKKKDETKCKEEKEKKKDETTCKEEKDQDVATTDKPKTEASKPVEAAPVYKRLADKYNPKPRKPTTEAEVPKKVLESIGNEMKTPPPLIPFLETSRSSTKQLPLPQLPLLNVPLLSPTSSTNSADNEISAYNKKALPLVKPLPQSNNIQLTPSHGPHMCHAPQISNLVGPAVPSHVGPSVPSHVGHATPINVNNILTNPNTTALVNNVVNQFKGRPGILPLNQNFPQQGPNQGNFGNMSHPSPNQGNFGNMPQPSQNQGNFGGNGHPPNQGNFGGNSHPPNQGNFGGNAHPPNEMHYNPPGQQQGPGFWGNQNQNFPQRSFTPVPNQFENQMQPIDYYPPGSTPTHNNFGHQPPPLLSPQYDNFDSRPHRGQGDDHLFGNKDRDMRYRENEWRRHPQNQWNRDSGREPNRDPRLQRDPRGYREDPRSTPRRDSREFDRDSRPRFRDPRLNRYRLERDPSNGSRSSRSESRDSEDGNTFASPLDSLYSGNEGYRKTGKGYGVQNFKIPKIKKEEETEEAEGDAKAAQEAAPEAKGGASNVCGSPTSGGASATSVVGSTPSVPSVGEVATSKKDLSVSEETVASTSVSSSTECDAKESTDSVKQSNESAPEPVKEAAEVGEISSTNDIQDIQSRDAAKLDDPSQTDIINKFLKKLLENERTRAAASLFIDNVSNSLDDEKLKMVVQTVKSATVEEEKEEKRPVPKRISKKAKLKAKLAAKKKQAVQQRKMRLRRQRQKAASTPVPDAKEEQEEEKKEEEEEEEVLVTVGERIKSRRRQASAGTPKKKGKHRTELDLLHEDIQDMFIRDGVLTATGKRMCRLLKNDSESKPPPQPSPPEPRTRRSKSISEKFDTKANIDKLKAMSNVRVLLPKISVDKLELDEESQRYSLRRATKPNKSYAEEDTDEEKDKEDNKDKKEESDEDEEKEEEPEVVEKEKVESPKKMRKRSKTWASGVIPKRKKREAAVVEEEEDKADEEEEKKVEEKEKPVEEEKVELVEPDKNYFSSKLWHFKMSCKLCDFCGKNITQHYRHKHPDSEVLSSRLTPQKAEEAIKESQRLKLDDKEDLQLTKQIPFRCRFCDLDMESKAANFYDHVSTHTGEYRHLCTRCPYSSCNAKPLKAHFLKAHGKEKDNKPVWIHWQINGYICLECNFVQMNKKAVENHVNVYHLGEGKKIMKIHLSSIDYKQKYDGRVAKKAGMKTPPPVKETEKEGESSDEPPPKKVKLTDKAEDKAEEVEVVKEQEVKAAPEPVIKKEKEIDMTVFTCNTDIQEENEKIEQERLKKMTELNDSVKTSRQSLNFVEQLSNRLREQDEAPVPEVVLVKSEPVDQDMVPEPEPVLETVAKKSSKMMEPPTSSSVEVVQKDNSIIQGMIQKLQGKLKEEKAPMDEPPPLAPLLEKPNDDTTMLSAGFLNIIKYAESYEYACRVPSCLVSTTDRDSFLNHWNEDHTRINQSYKATKCRICQMEVTATADGPLLANFFAHIENEHLEQRNILRTRRLSGDKLSTTPKEEEELDVNEEDENPFPFKISGVMSLAEDPIPPLSPIKEKTPKIESVILKEAKMNISEKAVAWKCPDAIKKFLQCPRELYKCPQFFCKFATNWRHLFESHIKAHARVNDELVCCVYCFVKTPLSHAGLHIDLRHSNCLYACSQCLYRALTREYVVVHMKLRHKENDLIVSLPPKTAKTIMMSKQKRHTVKEACPAYVCGHKGCGEQFLYQDEFCDHLKHFHDIISWCGYLTNQTKCGYKCVMLENMIDHWQTHGCYSFHCLICKTGTAEVYAMLEHYSVEHPNVEPVVVDRRVSPAGGTHFYTDQACANIKYVNEELLEAVNAQQSVAAPEKPPETTEVAVSEPPKSVTLLPLSLIQRSAASENKIIAIIPKPVEGPKPGHHLSSFVFAIQPEEKEKAAVEVPKEVSPPEETEASGADPLSLDGEVGGTISASGDESDSPELNDNNDMKSFGLIGYQLFRCAFCDISFSNARDFKNHCVRSKQCREKSAMKQFKCAHCGRLFKNPQGLLEHVQYHGQLRFGCSLCIRKFPSSFPLRVHMRIKHNVTKTITTPVVPNKINPEVDEFVLRPVSARNEGSNQQNSFGPEEIDQLPKRYIFNSDVKCALCSYSTKVRTNLVRHLQFHSAEKSVPDIAPVNPVPCLDKNEKMFDKMTNLAISSFTGANASRMGGAKPEQKVEEQEQVPAYVPSHRRYVCCADGCNYLCLEEANLRHHLYALHVQEPTLTCAHCKRTLKTDIEGFLKHLKLHDLHLYKCSHCNFVHNLRHKVDKHSADKHPDKGQNTITVRSLEAESVEQDQSQSGGANAPSEIPPSNIKWTKPWHCGMCKYRCAAKNDIVTHIYNKHDINTQFKCTLCSYKTNEKQTFDGHFSENHPDNEIDIIHVYYKSEGTVQANVVTPKQFDTTPLWQRDRPRVRHIRGILFEETSPHKFSKKGVGARTAAVTVTATSTTSSTVTSAPSTSTASNLDLAIEAVATGADSVNTKEPEEEADDSVIVIEDDEDEDMLNDTAGSELLIDIDDGAESSSTKVKQEQEKGLLSEEMLVNKYGKMCDPVSKSFKCPVCLKFKTRKISILVYHLLVELKCHRFKCNSCDYSCVSYDTMVPHCQDKHNSITATNVTDTPVDSTVEYWIQMVIRHQTRAMVRTSAPPNGEESQTNVCRAQCDFCHRWFKSVHVVKEHELFHWAEHTYTCGHCCSEHVTLNELFQHTFLSHPTFECSVNTNGPYVAKVIATLKSPSVGAAPQPSSSAADETSYVCAYCAVSEKNLELLRKHFDECHKNDGEEFQYTVVNKSKTEAMYCCSHCHERGSYKVMRKHHADKHPGLKFNIYQYICLECSGTFLNIKELRAHFFKSHAGKKLTYSCVENKESGSKDQYCCTKCPFRSCSVGGIRSHLRKHLRPIDCLTCGATFVYPTEAKAHHAKEHLHNAEAVEENKDRLKEYEEIIGQIVAKKESAARQTPPKKMLARKSTGAPFVREYSFYGTKKEQVDLKSVTTNIE